MLASAEVARYGRAATLVHVRLRYMQRIGVHTFRLLQGSCPWCNQWNYGIKTCTCLIWLLVVYDMS